MNSLRNLLIVTDRYPHAYDAISSSFVKSQVDCIKEYFDKIVVISLTPIMPKFLTRFSFIKPRWRGDAYAMDYEYDNVSVYYAKYPTLPFDIFRKRRGNFAFRAIYNILKSNMLVFDLIHAHFTYPSGYVSAKLKEIYNKPFVLTVHEDRECFLKEINDQNAVYTWHSSDKIIRVNKIDLKEFAKINIETFKLVHIPNGFSLDLFRPQPVDFARKELDLPTDKKILVNIASLEEYKGQKYLVKAMKDILNTRNDVMLYIVGQGSLEHDLQSQIDEFNLQNNVILAGGNKPLGEIALWMNACDLFVLPSMSEGNPTVMFEALGCGKPFVGTNVGGIPEIIIDEKLGILAEPKNVDGLTKAILRAIDTEWDREYILKYAKQFTWDTIAEKIVDMYDEVLRAY